MENVPGYGPHERSKSGDASFQKRGAALRSVPGGHINSQEHRGRNNKQDGSEAKARFSEFLEASVREGPQIVTRRGVEAAVRSREGGMAQSDLKAPLLAPEARTEAFAPSRTRRCTTSAFEQAGLLDIVSELRRLRKGVLDRRGSRGSAISVRRYGGRDSGPH